MVIFTISVWLVHRGEFHAHGNFALGLIYSNLDFGRRMEAKVYNRAFDQALSETFIRPHFVFKFFTLRFVTRKSRYESVIWVDNHEITLIISLNIRCLFIPNTLPKFHSDKLDHVEIGRNLRVLIADERIDDPAAKCFSHVLNCFIQLLVCFILLFINLP